MPMHENDFRLVISAEVDELLMSAPKLSPASLFNQAVDELAVIAAGDYESGPGGKTHKIFRLTQERLVKIMQLAASTGISENDVAIAAIRQYARKHPT